MTVQQLSVFIENKSGRLNEILDIIGKSNLRIIAATVADTSEYGILRLITSNNEEARALLKNNHVSVNRSEVFVLASNGNAGDFAYQLGCFRRAGISIEYMYCFSMNGKAFLILRTHDPKAGEKVIVENQLLTLSEEELKQL